MAAARDLESAGASVVVVEARDRVGGRVHTGRSGSEGMKGVVRRLSWLGEAAPLRSSQTFTWDEDEWARGGYAVFDPKYDPVLRAPPGAWYSPVNIPACDGRVS